MRMTSKERVRMAFRFEEPDRVPVFEQGIASNVASGILGRHACTSCGGSGWREVVEMLYKGKRNLLVQKLCEDTVELYSRLDLDIIRMPLAPASDAKGPDRKLDENTYYYEDEETGSWSIRRYNPESKTLMLVDSSVRREGLPAIERLVERLESESIEYDESVFETLDYAVEKVGDERFIAGGGGMAVPADTPWLRTLMTRPDLIIRYLDAQLERTQESVRLQKRHGIDFILGGGDLADNHGPLYSPKLFRRIVLPRLKKLISYCHELGLPYIFRTDGNTWPLAKGLFIESGVDGYGEIDAQAGMDLAEIREKLPHLVLWGNVDCAKTLPFGPKENIINETRRCIEKGGPGGGYILGSSNTIHPNVPADHFLSMLKAARKYGSYARLKSSVS